MDINDATGAIDLMVFGAIYICRHCNTVRSVPDLSEVSFRDAFASAFCLFTCLDFQWHFMYSLYILDPFLACSPVTIPTWMAQPVIHNILLPDSIFFFFFFWGGCHGGKERNASCTP